MAKLVCGVGFNDKTRPAKVDGKMVKEYVLWQILTTDDRLHGSPMEHQATPMSIDFFCFDCLKDAEECWEKGVTHLDREGKFW